MARLTFVSGSLLIALRCVTLQLAFYFLKFADNKREIPCKLFINFTTRGSIYSERRVGQSF